MTMIEVLLWGKPYLVLMKLLETTKEKKSMIWISWETRIVFSHITDLINTMEENGLVSTEKSGRIREVTLTKKGRIFAQGVQDLIKKLEEIEDGQ